MDIDIQRLRDRVFTWQQDKSIYRPLESTKAEFRVLLLHAGRAEDPIEAELQLKQLDEPSVQQYETISYCWGDPSITATVQVNGQTVTVPASSAAALRCIREIHNDRTVWLDAVCINQADLDERTQQVAIMADIYSNSKGNLIYFGEESSLTLRAIECIQRCLEEIKEATANFEKVQDTPLDWRRGADMRFDWANVELIDSEALASFFANPWFRRVWPLQEVALAPSNTCLSGPWISDFLDVVRVTRWLCCTPRTGRMKLLIDHRGFLSAANMWDVTDHSLSDGWGDGDKSFYNDAGWKLHHFLCSIQTREATEARDYVYGFLGLMNKIRLWNGLPPISGVRVDYRAPVEEVFRDATRSALLESTGRSVFAFISHRSEEDIESTHDPSWSYHPNKPFDRDQDPAQFYHQFDASPIPNYIFHMSDSVDKNLLITQGLVLERIASVCEVLERATWKDLSNLQTWLSDCLAQVQKHTNGGISHGDIAMSLLAGLGDRGQRATNDDIRALSELLEDDKATLLPFSGLEDQAEAEARWSAIVNVHEKMPRVMNRRIFLVQSGSIGLGPKLTKTGDIVAVLYGCSVPVVLRPSGEECRFVGTCYMSGVMDGEAVRMHQEIGAPDVEFRIR